eukprot:TRINITY_DN4829_c0_g2_i1.p2 TRINITY_DN4829_c0_g2~~TRINITY_DN4829_c0_g2_i1.p2  ORF type:complete len:136 (+),score=16.17 TRINITY_DN4829_c0_g2_i1:79-486(+)
MSRYIVTERKRDEGPGWIGTLLRAIPEVMVIPLPGGFCLRLRKEKAKEVTIGIAVGCAVGVVLRYLSGELRRRQDEKRADVGGEGFKSGRVLGGRPRSPITTTDRGHSTKRSARHRKIPKTDLDFLRTRPPPPRN